MRLLSRLPKLLVKVTFNYCLHARLEQHCSKCHQQGNSFHQDKIVRQ